MYKCLIYMFNMCMLKYKHTYVQNTNLIMDMLQKLRKSYIENVIFLVYILYKVLCTNIFAYSKYVVKHYNNNT